MYITSNKWMRAGYGKSIRAFFCKHNPLKIIGTTLRFEKRFNLIKDWLQEPIL